MSLFDSVLGAVTNHVQQQGGLANVLSGLLANNGEAGGLNGLVEKFRQAGLGDAVNSWIGTGANQAISGDQLSDALGSDMVTKAASQLGLDPSQLSGQLAQMLPGLIDKLTPNGTAPEGGLGNAGDLMGMLGGLLGKA
ncbi:MAG: YidB family protein [Rhodoferax sp.]|uniref:YidB family protein n=1 Tax=Rhodoferax sp. TaxID=50421 RepID=UPI0026289243|nr:YidB family protein [Rhodoferax sp.]MDD2878985.1 YidB family protein [Rhodoferax sp.]